jgi:glycosyltransferase involved in cell wall biosynthesis
MIVKNEEEVLARCLESVRGIADEIVVVDTGSTDRTREIAREFTDKVYDFEWIGDFSAARNFAFSKGTKEYLFWLDADDVLCRGAREKLTRLKRTLSTSVDIVVMKYHTHFDVRGNPVMTSSRGRLFKRERGYIWHDPVHEYIELFGAVHYADNIFVTHKKAEKKAIFDPFRNIKIYEKQIENGVPFSPRSRYYYARELFDHGRYADAAKSFEEFLDGGEGWVEDNLCACSLLADCYSERGDTEKALSALFRSFSYDAPRSELLSAVGYRYKEKGDFARAARWFKLALGAEKPNTLGFVKDDYYYFVPALELAVCLDRIGKTAEANAANELAATFKKDDPAVLKNRAYFKLKIES